MGGKTSTSTQQVTIPPEVMARYNAVNARAETVAEKPFQVYSNDPSAFVAPLTRPQQAGIEQTMQSAQQAQPYFQAATGQLLGAQGSAQPLMSQAQALAGESARGVSPGELQTQQYMSPYIQNVVEAQRGLTQRQQEAQMSGAMGQAIRSGAYGGDRAGIAAANLAREQQLAQAGILSPLLQQGYTQALQTAQQQQGLGLSAEQANRAAQAQAAQLMGGLGAQQFGMGAQTAQQLAGLGTGAQGAALQGAQAQMGAGQMAQQTEQAGLQALYNQFLQQQSYPFQVAQFLANIAMGTGALSGSTTTTRQPGGFFSDSRLKEDIEKVGELHDGQPIFKFRYKGEPKEATKIGLMADEVEKDKPEAVGLAGGFRTVNYDDATKDAASMGGGVMPRHAGERFAAGGYADGGSPIAPGLGGGDLAALLQAQAQMYSPYSSQGPYMGASSPAYGGGAYVPQASLPVTGLVAPSGPMPDQPSVIQSMNEMAELGQNVAKGYKAGKDRGWWGGTTTETTTPGGVAPPAGQADAQRVAEAEEILRQRGPVMARGGLVQDSLFEGREERAIGGGLGDTPYSSSGQGLSIPQQAGDESLSLPRASGGGVNPYALQGPGLAIPTETPEKPEMIKPAEMGKPRTPFEDVQDVARMAAMFMADGGVAAGGRHGYATDGSVNDPPYTQFPVMGGITRDGVTAPTPPRPRDPSFLDRLIEAGPSAMGAATQGGVAPSPRQAGASGSWDYAPGVSAPPSGVAGGARQPTRPSAPTQTSDALIAAGRPSAAQLAASTPAGLAGGTVGMSPAEQQAAIALRGAPGKTPEELAGYVPPKGSPNELRGGPGRGEVLYRQAVDKAKALGLNKAENLIPLLTGISAMGVAPTRSLGVALAAGLGAGAQAYMPTKQALAEVEQTKATTGRIGAEEQATMAQAMESRARTFGQLVNNYAMEGFTVVADPNGPHEFMGTRYSIMPRAQGIQQAPGGAGPAPAAGQASLLSPEVAQGLTRDKVAAYYRSDRKANETAYNDLITTGADSARQHQQNVKYALTFAEMQDPQPGAFTPLFTDIAARVNDLLRKGLGPNAPQYSAESVTNRQMLDKMSQEVARIAASVTGGDNVQNLVLALQAVPTAGMDRAAGIELLSQMMIANQRSMDRAKYAMDYGSAVSNVSRDPTLARSYPISDAMFAQASDPRFTSAQYANEQKLLKGYISNPQAFRTIAKYLQDPSTRDAQMKMLAEQTGNPYFYRYFTGAF